jgi:hypothetical protein
MTGVTQKPNVANPLVSFPLLDAYVPSPHEILQALHGEEILQGRIIDYSDGGTGGTTYAVVAVEGLLQPVIIPVEKLRTDCE